MGSGMAERNPGDPAAAAAAVGRAAEADVFSSEPRSFKIDRRSPEASALRDAVSQKLLDFLGSYSDDVLTEYIIVLVCNGKHQNQARDDLEAFLGNESEKFVAWLWDYLSDQLIVSKLPHLDCLDMKTKSTGGLCDPSSFNKNLSYVNKVEDSGRCKDWSASDIPSVDVRTDRSQEQACAAYGKVGLTNNNQSGSKIYMAASLMSSPKTFSGGEQCLQSQSQHQKIAESNSSAVLCQPLHVPKTEPVARNLQPITREDTKSKPLSIRSAVPRQLSAKDVEEAQIARPRGNVWDRLGKPCKDESKLRAEKHHAMIREKVNNHVEELQGPRSMLVEPYERLISNDIEKVSVLDKSHGRIISNHHSEGYDMEHNTLGSFEQLGKAKRTKHNGGVNSGNISASFSGSEESFLHNKESFQKARESLPVKRQRLPRSNELATDAKSTTGILPEPAGPSLKSHKAQSDKVVQSLLKENISSTTAMLNPVPCNSSASDKFQSIKCASGISETRPMQNEILDVKLKLQRVEKDMDKLRSKQADLNNSKPIPSSGLQNSLKDDVESRTVFVTNVHFAASREALLSHFTNCGLIVKVTMLTDTITGQPKGEAYIVFANKESVEKAASLSGTSFFSRILTVIRKAEMPPGSSVPTQPAMKLPQPWYSQPQSYKKGPLPRHYTGSHLQWRRDEPTTRESSVPATSKRLESSNAGK